MSTTMRLTLNAIFGRIMPLHIYRDSKSFYDSIVRINSTTEKRLLIDLRMLRQSCERRGIPHVFEVPTDQNPADDLTNRTPCPALSKLMHKNMIHLTPNALEEGEIPKWV